MSTLADSQRAFAAHLRDPQRQPRPADVPACRMAIYRELFHNNLARLLANHFPVLRTISSDADWHALAGDFGAEHRAASPLYPELPREFLRYLDGERRPRPTDPPFLAELAHYEWVELALAQDPAELDAVDADPDGDCVSGVPVLSPLAWPLTYRFPVQRIGPDYLPDAPPEQATNLLCYRDRRDAVHFMLLNAVAARLLSLLQKHPERSGREQLRAITAELQHPQPEAVLAGGRAILQDLHRRDVILGIRC